MKKVFRIFKGLAFFVVALVALVTALVLVVLQRPSLLLNDKTLEWGKRQAAKSGIEVDWSTFNIRSETISFFSRRFILEGRDVCVHARAQGVESCFKELFVSVAGDISGFKPKVTEIGPVRMLGGWMDADLPDDDGETSDPEKKKSGELGVPEFIRGAQIRPIQIELKSWRIKSGQEKLRGSFKIASDADSNSEGGPAQIIAELSGIRQGLKKGERADLDVLLKLENPKGYWDFGGWKLDSKLIAKVADGTRASVEAKVNPEVARYVYDIKATYGRKAQPADVRIVGGLQASEATARIQATAKSLFPSFARITLRECDLKLSRKTVEADESHLAMNCPVRVRAALPPSPIKDLKVPTDLGAVLKANIDGQSFPPDFSREVKGDVSIELQPILTPLLEGHGGVKSKIAGIPSEFPDRWQLDTDLGLTMAIPEFQKVVALLKHSQWAVPAPLHVLKGRMELGVEGKLDLEGGNLPVVMRTRLASASQKLDIDATGTVKLLRTKPTFALDIGMEIALSDVKLALPTLDLEAPPRLVPDSRIQRFAENELKDAAKSEVDYALQVRTGATPVEFSSNLARAPIPLHLNIELDSKTPPTGTIRITRFPLELFRREASVDHFQMRLASPTQESAIDGAVRIKYTDYTVSVLLVGTAGKPVVKMISDPPLPEDQVLAVLLFGRPMDELDPDQNSSVASTRTALADSAIGIASLYALASTPVQSVGYDPSTGEVTAKVRLGEGTSLNLGGTTAGQVSNVGIRKRLGPNWTIQTDLGAEDSTDNTGRNNVAGAMLEWSSRY